MCGVYMFAYIHIYVVVWLAGLIVLEASEFGAVKVRTSTRIRLFGVWVGGCNGVHLCLCFGLGGPHILHLTMTTTCTLPSSQVYDIKPGGRSIPVDDASKHEYIRLLAQFKMVRHASAGVHVRCHGCQWRGARAPIANIESSSIRR